MGKLIVIENSQASTVGESGGTHLPCRRSWRWWWAGLSNTLGSKALNSAVIPVSIYTKKSDLTAESFTSRHCNVQKFGEVAEFRGLYIAGPPWGWGSKGWSMRRGRGGNRGLAELSWVSEPLPLAKSSLRFRLGASYPEQKPRDRNFFHLDRL